MTQWCLVTFKVLSLWVWITGQTDQIMGWFCLSKSQRVHKLTQWETLLRADFLHPAWIVKGPWEEAFSKRKKKQFRIVYYGGIWKCKSSCYLHASSPHLCLCYPADTWSSSCAHYGRPIAHFPGGARSVLMHTFDSNLKLFGTSVIPSSTIKSSIQQCSITMVTGTPVLHFL